MTQIFKVRFTHDVSMLKIEDGYEKRTGFGVVRCIGPVVLCTYILARAPLPLWAYVLFGWPQNCFTSQFCSGIFLVSGVSFLSPLCKAYALQVLLSEASCIIACI